MTKHLSKPCSLVVVRNNKRLHGTAAQLAHISDCGGWDSFLSRVAESVIADFSDSYNQAVRKPSLVLVGKS